ncbi:MAG: penicillin-binding protein activator LpoB [Gammaproteobacteria bacterium]
MNRFLVATLVGASLLFTGCASKVQYGDAQAVETTTIDFGSTDLQMIAAKMVDDMLAFPPIVQVTQQRRPVIFVDKIKNKTTEHIDTESITDTIQTKLIKSGKFRFVDMTAVKAVQEQLDFQTESGMVNPAAAVKLGQQIGAEYMLYGNMASIVKQSGNTRDVYYKFTLKLQHLQSGIVEWQDEKEIRKTKSKSLLGR